MLRIKLVRFGKKDQPTWRVVVVESARTGRGRVTDFIGNYNPMISRKEFNLDIDKYNDWIKKGAQPTDTVLRLKGRFVDKNKDYQKEVPLKVYRNAEKEAAKVAEAEAAKKAAEDAKIAAAEAKAAAEEAAKNPAPVEEVASTEAPVSEVVETPEVPTEEVVAEEVTEAPAEAAEVVEEALAPTDEVPAEEAV
ncbi:MAG: 30S ribosomal protein S16 [Patescibacteria group bacterium]